MAEYVLKDGEEHADVARRLLAESDDPNSVLWAPRPDTYGGGVYVVNNEETVAKVARDLQAVRDRQAQQIADAQAAADERDAKADETGLTPTQLGIPANRGVDPGAPGTEGETPEDDEDADDTPVEDDPATPEDESQMTPAQKRKAARLAKAKQDEADAAKASSTDGEASEGAK